MLNCRSIKWIQYGKESISQQERGLAFQWQVVQCSAGILVTGGAVFRWHSSCRWCRVQPEFQWQVVQCLSGILVAGGVVFCWHSSGRLHVLSWRSSGRSHVLSWRSIVAVCTRSAGALVAVCTCSRLPLQRADAAGSIIVWICVTENKVNNILSFPL